ncbi:MAG: transcription antitermination factor NusB [Bacteroidales bacterium]|nr:transcription antitermination factor NusB [Bacteroidales bacterium]
MLTRRFLRIKVLQELYAYSSETAEDYAAAEKTLLQDIHKVYDLYIYQLSYILELIDFVSKRIEEARNKFYPTYEDLNPNTKFIENQVLQQLSENRSYKRHRDRLKINWADQQDIVRKTYFRLRDSEAYKNYMESGKRSFNEDKDFLVNMVREVILQDELLQNFYEEKYVNWANDFDGTILMLEKTFRNFKKEDDEYAPLPQLYTAPYDENNRNEDEEFVKKLFRNVVFNSKELDEMVSQHITNWDFERVALMDVILIKMAISEFLKFETIPIKVTMNEYIEIAKVFSTPKSSIFINGMLDKLLSELKEAGKVKKVGRGLINN